MSYIVKYNNDMNTVQFNKFKDKELDLFFSICYKLKERGLNKVALDFSELKKLSNYSSTSLLRFEKDLNSTYKKLLALNFKIIHSETKYTMFNLFSEYTVDMDLKNITIEVNPKYSYILNELGSNYTKFELEQFTNLKSIYSKNLFKLLKQWESIQIKEFEIQEFRRLLMIPESYDFKKINVKVLTIAMKELKPHFHNLNLEKIKAGRKIKKLKFTWSAPNMKQAKLLEIEIIISEKLEKTIEKTKKNKFINPILTKENIKKLLEIFDEKILISAFNKAYTEINKEINFNYLKTFIENTLKQQEIKFKVIKEVEDVETIKEKKEELKTETREPKEKIKVTEDEKKQKYEEYLKENNLQDNKFNKKSFEVPFNNDFELVEEEEVQLIEGASKEYLETNPNSRRDKEGHISPKEFENYASWMDYNKNYRKKNPEIIMKMTEEINQSRLRYEREFKAIELGLIVTDDERLEKFKKVSMRVLRLHAYIFEELKYERMEQIEIAERELTKVLDIIDTFKDVKREKIFLYSTGQYETIVGGEIIKFEDIEKEKLLSKNGKKLFGGALMSRLKKIAKKSKMKIKYKDQFINF